MSLNFGVRLDATTPPCVLSVNEACTKSSFHDAICTTVKSKAIVCDVVWFLSSLRSENVTVKGLEYRGYSELARVIAEKQLRAVWKVYEATGTIWEVYAPDIFMPATTAVHTELCRPNFVGWSGLMPISMLIENVLGFSVLEDAKGVFWTVLRRSRHGIENLRFGRIVASLLCEGDSVCVVSNGSFTLWLNGVKCEIRKGKQYFEVPR